jgi:hypothetical protein
MADWAYARAEPFPACTVLMKRYYRSDSAVFSKRGRTMRHGITTHHSEKKASWQRHTLGRELGTPFGQASLLGLD